MTDQPFASGPSGGPKKVLSPVEEALARQAARRPPKAPAKLLPVTPMIPKIKIGRKNRRKIPK